MQVVVVTSVVLLAQRAVRAMLVEMRRILGQHPREMAAVDDQDPVSNSRRTVPLHRSAIAFA
jgi:hypothetical protein